MWCVCVFLQDFNGVIVHPPYVGVEDEKICRSPMDSMLGNGFRHYDSLGNTVVSWII